MSKSSPVDRDTSGPFDISEVGLLTPYLDFGSIRLAPKQEMQIRADIDDTSKKVVALTVEIEGHRLQLQAFASTKSDGLWEATMSALIQGISSQGGLVEPVEGLLGQELRGSVPAKSGNQAISRPTRFIGVDGPRWFLRGVISASTISEEVYARLVSIFRSAAVSRGGIAMPPGELLPLRLPVSDKDE
jgi:hypothetical protein